MAMWTLYRRSPQANPRSALKRAFRLVDGDLVRAGADFRDIHQTESRSKFLRNRALG